MPKKPRIGEESFSYETQLDKMREVINEHDERLEALENALPKAPEPLDIKTKEECEEKGGKWDEEKNVCVLPPKEKEALEGQIGILPTSTSSPDVEKRANFFREKILGKEEK